MSRTLVFVDVETTGLDPEYDQLIELTFGTLTGTLQTLYFGVEKVAPFIDEMIGFTKRGIAGRTSPLTAFDDFYRLTEQQTMVAANPTFDRGFMVKNELYRFHHRSLDIESYAMAKLDLQEMPGMADVYNILTERGFKITEPDHTSRNDVQAMIDAYRVLRKL